MNRIIVALGLLAAASVSTACVPHIHDTFFVDGEGARRSTPCSASFW